MTSAEMTKLAQLENQRIQLRDLCLKFFNEIGPADQCPSINSGVIQLIEFFASHDETPLDPEGRSNGLSNNLRKCGLATESNFPIFHDEAENIDAFATLLYGINLGYAFHNLESMGRYIQKMKTMNLAEMNLGELEAND